MSVEITIQEKRYLAKTVEELDEILDKHNPWKKELTNEELRAFLGNVNKEVADYMKTPEGQEELRCFLKKHELTAEDLERRIE